MYYISNSLLFRQRILGLIIFCFVSLGLSLSLRTEQNLTFMETHEAVKESVSNV
jgi:hypothetical protein